MAKKTTKAVIAEYEARKQELEAQIHILECKVHSMRTWSSTARANISTSVAMLFKMMRKELSDNPEIKEAFLGALMSLDTAIEKKGLSDSTPGIH